jgi:hypothetical protein
LGQVLFPLEVSVKKRLTFSFLPWVAAAGVCLGGSFARSEEGSVLVGGDAAAATEAAAPADACMKTVKVWKMVPEIRDVEATEWTTEVRERSFTVKKRVPHEDGHIHRQRKRAGDEDDRVFREGSLHRTA